MSTWWTILGSAGVLTIAWNSFVRTKDAQQARTAKLHNQRHTALTVASKLSPMQPVRSMKHPGWSITRR